GAGGIATSGNFGTPIPSAPAPAVLGSIGIKTEFSLTSLDQATLTSSFQVTVIPAPGGLAMLGIGLLSGRRRRRRK
ncbi:MAG: PEP-CTERM sorting domain-containing protein, partial [Phycisphaerales bacterium]